MCHVDSNNSLSMDNTPDDGEKTESEHTVLPKKLSLDSSHPNFNSGTGTPLYADGGKSVTNENADFISFSACASGDSGIGSREDTDNVTDGKTLGSDVAKDVSGSTLTKQVNNGFLTDTEVTGTTFCSGSNVKSGVSVGQGIADKSIGVNSSPVTHRPLSPIVHVQNERTDKVKGNKDNTTDHGQVQVTTVKQVPNEDKRVKSTSNNTTPRRVNDKFIHKKDIARTTEKQEKETKPHSHNTNKHINETVSSIGDEARSTKSCHVRNQAPRNRYKLKSDGTSDDSSVETDTEHWKRNTKGGDFDICDIHISTKRGHHRLPKPFSVSYSDITKDANANVSEPKKDRTHHIEKYPGIRHSLYSKTHPLYDFQEGSMKKSKHSKPRRKSCSPKLRSVKDSSKTSIDSQLDKCNKCSSGSEVNNLPKSDSVTFQESLV